LLPPRGQLFEFNQYLVEFDRFPRRYLHGLHFSRNRGRNAGFHLHGLENHEQIVQLQLFSGLHAHAHDDSSHRTAAHFRLIGIALCMRVWSRRQSAPLAWTEPSPIPAFNLNLNFVGFSANRDCIFIGGSSKAIWRPQPPGEPIAMVAFVQS
jgi:hypothetical protein